MRSPAGREFRHEAAIVRKSVAEENSKKEKLAKETGLVHKQPDTRKQEMALAAANAALVHPEECENIKKMANISDPTFRKGCCPGKGSQWKAHITVCDSLCRRRTCGTVHASPCWSPCLPPGHEAPYSLLQNT